MQKSSGINQQVYHTLGRYLGLDPSKLQSEDSLRDDLGLDSLQTIELVYEVESAFDLQIPDEDFGRLITIGDVVQYLHERMERGGTSPSLSPSTPAIPKTAHSPSKRKGPAHKRQ